MTTHKLGQLVRGAYENLRNLAPQFNRPDYAQAYRILWTLETPVVPPPAEDLPVGYPHGPVDEVAFSPDPAINAALTEADKLERAADVLANAGGFDLEGRLTDDALRIKNAIMDRDTP